MAKSPEARAAQALLELRHSFGISRVWYPCAVDEAADTIAMHGTAEEAVMALAAIPARQCYARARMTLLWRILLLPEHHIATPWNTEKFENMKFLDAEHDAMEAFFFNHPEVLGAIIGSANRPRFRVLEGGLS